MNLIHPHAAGVHRAHRHTSIYSLRNYVLPIARRRVASSALAAPRARDTGLEFDSYVIRVSGEGDPDRRTRIAVMS
jgi:hypothetical protein